MFVAGERVGLSQHGKALLRSPEKSLFHRIVLNVLATEPATVETTLEGGLVKIRFDHAIASLALDSCLVEEESLEKEKPAD